MNFNPDPFKQAEEVLFSRKSKSQNHLCLYFKNNIVNQTPLQKHLGMYLDQKLDFLEHSKNIQAKVNKSITLLRKLQTILPRPTLLTIYKDPTMIMVTSYMTKHKMILFTKNWSQFNIVSPLQ